MVQPRAISLSFVAEMDEVPRMRHFVELWLRSNHVPEPESSDLVLAASEAINNACLHGSPAPRSVHISCSRHGRRIEVGVSDEGEGVSLDPSVSEQAPPPDGTGGRGLSLIRRLTDQVTIKTTTRGTTVTFVREIVPRQRARSR